MKTYLHLSNIQSTELPRQFQNDDVRFSEQLVEYFLEHFTQMGDVVFDPFASFGTTLLVAGINRNLRHLVMRLTGVWVGWRKRFRY